VDHGRAGAGDPVEPTAATEELAHAAGDGPRDDARPAALEDGALHALGAVQGPEGSDEATQRLCQRSRLHQLERQDAALARGHRALREGEDVARLAKFLRVLVDDLEQPGA